MVQYWPGLKVKGASGFSQMRHRSWVTLSRLVMVAYTRLDRETEGDVDTTVCLKVSWNQTIVIRLIVQVKQFLSVGIRSPSAS